MAPYVLPDETSKETQEEFYRERNSLRRFLVGIIATTFGVLVALHPNVYASIMGRWCYVISVIANALSLLFFIGRFCVSAILRAKLLQKFDLCKSFAKKVALRMGYTRIEALPGGAARL